MDWFIYHLVGDVLIHYWYGVQCKIFGYIKNNFFEGIVINVMFRAHDIPSTNVLLYPYGVNIAFMASCNHPPKFWIVHAPNSKWPQCDYRLVARGIICIL